MSLPDILTRRKVGSDRRIEKYDLRLAQARVDQDQRVRALRRSGLVSLADKLGECRPAHHCGSGACPVCHSKLQQHFATALWQLAQQDAAPGETVVLVTWVPWVPWEAMVQEGELERRDHQNELRAWKRRLSPTNLRWLIGGVDFSLNQKGGEISTWTPHLYGIGVTSDVSELRDQLKGGTQATVETPRPVMVKPWDGRPNAALYALKGEFTRRVAYEGERYDSRRGAMAPCRKTSKQKLLAHQKIELWEHLDQIGLTSRIFAIRAQVYNLRHKVKIRLL